MSAEEKAATDGGEEEVEKVVIPGLPDAMLKVAVGPMVLIFRGGWRVGARTAWTRGLKKQSREFLALDEGTKMDQAGAG